MSTIEISQDKLNALASSIGMNPKSTEFDSQGGFTTILFKDLDDGHYVQTILAWNANATFTLTSTLFKALPNRDKNVFKVDMQVSTSIEDAFQKAAGQVNDLALWKKRIQTAERTTAIVEAVANEFDMVGISGVGASAALKAMTAHWRDHLRQGSTPTIIACDIDVLKEILDVIRAEIWTRVRQDGIEIDPLQEAIELADQSPLKDTETDRVLQVSVDGGHSFKAVSSGLRICVRHVDVPGEDDPGELHLNVTTEGVVSDLWVSREEHLDHNLGTSSETYDELVERLVDDPARADKSASSDALDHVFAELADHAFADYDFGDGVMVTDSSGWEYTSPGVHRSRTVYVESEPEDDGPAASWSLTFEVQFDPVMQTLVSAYAIDSKGQIWGKLPRKNKPRPLEPMACPDLVTKVVNVISQHGPKLVRHFGHTGYVVASMRRSNQALVVVNGDFGRQEFKAAFAELKSLNPKANTLVVVGKTATYSGPAIQFSKFDDLGISMD